MRRAAGRRLLSHMQTATDRLSGVGGETSRLDACMFQLASPAHHLTRLQDKRAVEAYKAGIKAKLTRAGLIRGQPRSSIIQATSSSSSSTSTVFATDQYQRPANGSIIPTFTNDAGTGSLTMVDTAHGQGQGESPMMMSMFGERRAPSPIQPVSDKCRVTA